MSADLLVSAGIIILLIVASAFFSGSETALTASSRARMHQLERQGDRRAGMVQQLMRARERLIGALLLGNNLANIGSSALATGVLLKLFGDAGILYATVIMTVLVLVFAEVLPKTYAILNPDRSALFVAPPVRLITNLLGPVVSLVESIVRVTLRLIGADRAQAEDAMAAREEIRGAIDLHHSEGAVVKRDRDMLGGILDLGDLEVSDVMIHRTKMQMIDIETPQAQMIQEILKSGHTRLPLWHDKPDNIVGIVHAKDMLAALNRSGGDASTLDIEEIMTPPWFVPDTRPLADQLNAFLRRKAHFAIVVDEYGELMGLVTLEDIIEEIVGDISDEHDITVPGVRQQPDGSFIIDGTVPVRDLNRLNDWKLPDEEATTLAGLVIHEARMIPAAGQAFHFHGFRFEVLRRRKNQVTLIRVTPERR